MRLTIVREDNAVLVDGEAYEVDCSPLPSYVRVVQWTGSEGWLELAPDGNGVQPSNLPISTITPYAWAVERWKIAKRGKELQTIVSDLERQYETEQQRLAQQAAAQAMVDQQAMVEAERAGLQARLEVLEQRQNELLAKLASLGAANG
jgi:hypothetical protein